MIEIIALPVALLLVIIVVGTICEISGKGRDYDWSQFGTLSIIVIVLTVIYLLTA